MLGIFAVWNFRTGSTYVATLPTPKAPDQVKQTDADEQVVQTPTGGTPLVAGTTNLPAKEIGKIVRASAAASQREIKPYTSDYHVTANTPVDDRYLPGEESYVKTISDLKQNVDSQKDSVMTPSSRVSYERDMAMVNDSIKRMREVVKKNPRNQAARQVLYSSYQDKIDLLNSVSQREELMASLR
jgi:hypothetical protein